MLFLRLRAATDVEQLALWPFAILAGKPVWELRLLVFVEVVIDRFKGV